MIPRDLEGSWELAYFGRKSLVQVSLSASTNFADDPNRLIERENSVATLRLSLDQLTPTAGIPVEVSRHSGDGECG